MADITIYIWLVVYLPLWKIAKSTPLWFMVYGIPTPLFLVFMSIYGLYKSTYIWGGTILCGLWYSDIPQYCTWYIYRQIAIIHQAKIGREIFLILQWFHSADVPLPQRAIVFVRGRGAAIGPGNKNIIQSYRVFHLWNAGTTPLPNESSVVQSTQNNYSELRPLQLYRSPFVPFLTPRSTDIWGHKLRLEW